MEGIVNLEEFVSETMRQIIAGVKKAQAGEDGANVNASFPDTLGSNLSFNPAYGTFSRVDFDVALTAEQSGQAGGSLKVWGLASAEAGGKTSAQTVSQSCLPCLCVCLTATSPSALRLKPRTKPSAAG